MEPVDESSHSPKYSFCDDGGRPQIEKYPDEPRYRPNDEVYIRPTATTTREGPYRVSSVENRKYTLCDANGNVVKDGNAFEERFLELKDPFE
ncbi:MAG: hypothetical protein Q9196_001179 [Gyalolechia fulgens]